MGPARIQFSSARQRGKRECGVSGIRLQMRRGRWNLPGYVRKR